MMRIDIEALEKTLGMEIPEVGRVSRSEHADHPVAQTLSMCHAGIAQFADDAERRYLV